MVVAWNAGMCNVAVVGVKEAWQEICCCHSFLLLLVAKTTYMTFCSFYRKSMTDSFFCSYFFFSNCKTCIIKKIQSVTMLFMVCCWLWIKIKMRVVIIVLLCTGDWKDGLFACFCLKQSFSKTKINIMGGNIQQKCILHSDRRSAIASR